MSNTKVKLCSSWICIQHHSEGDQSQGIPSRKNTECQALYTIYQLGKPIKAAVVEWIMKNLSLVPTLVSYSYEERLFCCWCPLLSDWSWILECVCWRSVTPWLWFIFYFCCRPYAWIWAWCVEVSPHTSDLNTLCTRPRTHRDTERTVKFWSLYHFKLLTSKLTLDTMQFHHFVLILFANFHLMFQTWGKEQQDTLRICCRCVHTASALVVSSIASPRMTSTVLLVFHTCFRWPVSSGAQLDCQSTAIPSLRVACTCQAQTPVRGLPSFAWSCP